MPTPDDLGPVTGDERAVQTCRAGLFRLGMARCGAVAETDTAGVFKNQEQISPNVVTVWTEEDV